MNGMDDASLLDHYTLINHLEVVLSLTNCVKESWFRAQED